MLEFLWKIGNRSDAYTTEAHRKKLQLFQWLQSEHPGFANFVNGFVDRDHKKVRKVVNSVLFRRIPPGAWGSPQGSWAQEAIKSAIQILAHTVRSSERWIGHPSIPLRVFGLAKYLDEPLRQLTKPQAAAMPRSNNDSPTFDTQASSSWAEDFQPTRCEEFVPRFKEQSLKFAHWFDFTFADYSMELRQKAIRAGQEATCHTLFKALDQYCGLPSPGQDQQPVELVYALETCDIRYRKE